jgi:hypothetical protein
MRRRKWWEVGENCMLRYFTLLPFSRYHYSDQIKRMKWAVHVTHTWER